MAITVPSGGSQLYGGEVLGQVVAKQFEKHSLYNAGKLYVQGGFKYKFTVPVSDPTYAIQDNTPTPTSSGTLNFKDKVLTLDDYNMYQEFNPRSLETYWKPFQPTGPLVFEALPANIQANMLGEIFGFLGQYHAKADMVGDKVSGVAPFNKYNGLITKLKSGTAEFASVVSVAISGAFSTAGTAALSPTNVLASFDKAKSAIQYSSNGEIRVAYDNPNFFWTVSPLTLSLYGDAQKNASYKGVDFTSAGVAMYDGKPIISQPGFPENMILGTYGSRDTGSNLWIGVSDTSDDSTIKVDRLQANSELYFAKMIMARDTQIIRPEHAILVS